MKKKFLILSIVAVILISGIFAFMSRANQKTALSQATNSCSTRDTVISTLLYPEIRKNIDKYYEPYFNTQLNISPDFMSVLDIKKATSGYDVTLQVSPYLGPHNAIGEDIIVINVTTNQIVTKEFKHIESYDVPDWLKQYVIKWPPQ